MSRKTFVPVLFLVPCLGVSAQARPSAAIPATEPTQSISDLPSASPVRHGESRVQWNGSTLAIEAGGDSLRNILIKVARATGMKINGGIPDEQVFGSYGPGSAQQILTDLFEGMSVNMLLMNGSAVKPKELVLTARTGGVTPPSATPLNDSDYAQQAPPSQQPPTAIRQMPVGRFPPNAVTPAGTPAFPMQNAPGQPVDDSTGTQTGTDANGTPQSPNGTRTPEQIFDELRRRQQGNTTQ